MRLSGETWSGVASGVWWGGAAGFEPAETDWASSLRELGDARGTIDVPVVTVDAYTRAIGAVPDLIKVDVEGAEDRVLAGAAATLAESGPDLLCEVSPRVTSIERIRELLARFGYVHERFWTFQNGAAVRDDRMDLAEGRNVINYFTSESGAIGQRRQ